MKTCRYIIIETKQRQKGLCAGSVQILKPDKIKKAGKTENRLFLAYR